MSEYLIFTQRFAHDTTAHCIFYFSDNTIEVYPLEFTPLRCQSDASERENKNAHNYGRNRCSFDISYRSRVPLQKRLESFDAEAFDLLIAEHFLSLSTYLILSTLSASTFLSLSADGFLFKNVFSREVIPLSLHLNPLHHSLI